MWRRIRCKVSSRRAKMSTGGRLYAKFVLKKTYRNVELDVKWRVVAQKSSTGGWLSTKFDLKNVVWIELSIYLVQCIISTYCTIVWLLIKKIRGGAALPLQDDHIALECDIASIRRHARPGQEVPFLASREICTLGLESAHGTSACIRLLFAHTGSDLEVIITSLLTADERTDFRNGCLFVSRM